MARCDPVAARNAHPEVAGAPECGTTRPHVVVCIRIVDPFDDSNVSAAIEVGSHLASALSSDYDSQLSNMHSHLGIT
jgi:hypothetical protein